MTGSVKSTTSVVSSVSVPIPAPVRRALATDPPTLAGVSNDELDEFDHVTFSILGILEDNPMRYWWQESGIHTVLDLLQVPFGSIPNYHIRDTNGNLS